MSYSVLQGLSDVPQFPMQWNDNESSGWPSGFADMCGHRVAAQVMLTDLGYGPLDKNVDDPKFFEAFAAFARERSILYPADPAGYAAAPNPQMCLALMNEWYATANVQATNEWTKQLAWSIGPGAKRPPIVPPAPGGFIMVPGDGTPNVYYMSSSQPHCGYQVAAQIMLGDLGYGNRKTNGRDPGYWKAIAEYAADRGLRYTEGEYPTPTVCQRLLADWQTIAYAWGPQDPTYESMFGKGAGDYWVKRPGVAVPPRPTAPAQVAPTPAPSPSTPPPVATPTCPSGSVWIGGACMALRRADEPAAVPVALPVSPPPPPAEPVVRPVCSTGFKWDGAQCRPADEVPHRAAPAAIPVGPPPPPPVLLVAPPPPAPATPVAKAQGWWAAQSQTTRYALIGGGVLALVAVVSLGKEAA